MQWIQCYVQQSWGWWGWVDAQGLQHLVLIEHASEVLTVSLLTEQEPLSIAVHAVPPTPFVCFVLHPLVFSSLRPCENSQLPETRDGLRVGLELGICKTQEPPHMLARDWMRQQVVKGPLKINVIMKASRVGLSGLGSKRQQEEEERRAANVMFHWQNLIFQPKSEEHVKFLQLLFIRSYNRNWKGRKEGCNTCSRVPGKNPLVL